MSSNKHRGHDVSDRHFLFEYRFDGDIYGQSIVAPDIETARRKVSAMSAAIYKGEIAATIPLNPRWWRWVWR
jgi:hypothetical protein